MDGCCGAGLSKNGADECKADAAGTRTATAGRSHPVFPDPDSEAVLALCMATHARLGCRSPARRLTWDALRRIASFVKRECRAVHSPPSVATLR